MFNVGDKVFHIGNAYIPIDYVEILAKPDEENHQYYKIRSFDFGGTYGGLPDDLFYDRELAVKKLKERELSRQKDISKDIKSVGDLLQMMYECMFCEEYTDYDKIAVAKQKAKDLCGVELE